VITLIKEYQTLIVGGLGFVGVIATLLTNARLTRRQYARQIERESSNVKAALRSKLGIIRAAFSAGSAGLLEDLVPVCREAGRLIMAIYASPSVAARFYWISIPQSRTCAPGKRF